MASKTPPSSTPSLAPQDILLQAITSATTTGIWGDVRFVISSPFPGERFVTLWADLSVLKANGADYLAEQIIQSHYRSAEEAHNAALSPGSSLRQQASHAANDHSNAPTTNVLYYPVSGISFTTMRAILVFLQTGHIAFAPLRSTVLDEAEDEMDDASASSFVNASQSSVDRELQTSAILDLSSSPKSVYRAARKFRLAALRELASRAIDSQITPANCLPELFCLFTLKYQEVFEKRLTFVLTHWNDIDKDDRARIGQLMNACRNRVKAQEAFAHIMANTTIG